MTGFDDELRRALEILNQTHHMRTWVDLPDSTIKSKRLDIERPLAKLIRAAIWKPWPEGESRCQICGYYNGVHANNCALVALVRAVNGDLASK